MPTMNILLHNKDPDEVANGMIKEIVRVLDILAPVRTIQIRKNYAPYLQGSTKTMMKERNQVKSHYQTSNLMIDKLRYNKIRNDVVKAQRADKRKWATKELERSGNRSKNLWATVRKINGNSDKAAINTLNVNDVFLTKKVDIAESPTILSAK